MIRIRINELLQQSAVLSFATMLDKLQRSSAGFCRCGAGVYASKSGAIFRPEIALSIYT